MSDGDLLTGWLSQAAESERLAARFAELAGALSQGVAVFTRSTLVFANASVGRLLGIEADALPRMRLGRLVPDPDRRRALRAALLAAWQGQAADVTDVPVARGTGAPVGVTIALRPLPRETEPTLLAVLDETAPARAVATEADAGPRDPLRAFGLHLAGLANDLRGPLTAYLDHLAALADRTDLPADVREALGVYRAVTTETLGRLGRAMEWGRRSPLTERVDLRAVVHAAVAALPPHEQPSDRVRIRLDLEAAPVVRGLSDQLQWAVEHVLRNASEALIDRDAGGTIDVRLRSDNGRVALTVADDGPGIPPSLFPHVFEPFSSTKSIATGLGLGLAIVRDIVSRHQGEVSIQSGAAGTTVTLTFDAAAREEERQRQGPRNRVLVVDDNEYVRETYRALLGAAGWEVLCAGDADEALYLAGRHEVDALLVDVQMAGRDGLAVVEALALWHPHLLPRVALQTGYADEQRVRAAAQRHGLALLQKPCRSQVLLATLTALAGRVHPH